MYKMLVSVQNCTDLLIQNSDLKPVEITFTYSTSCCDETPKEITITPTPLCPDVRKDVIVLVTQERNTLEGCDCGSDCGTHCKQKWNFKFSIDPSMLVSFTGQMMTIDKNGVPSGWSTAPNINVSTAMEECDPYNYIYEYEVVLKTGCIATYSFYYDFRVEEGGVCNFAANGEYAYNMVIETTPPDFPSEDYTYEYDYKTGDILVLDFFTDLVDGVYSFTINGKTVCLFNTCGDTNCNIAEYLKKLLSPCDICSIDIEEAEKIKVLYDMINMLAYCDNCCQACNTYEKLISIINGTKCSKC